MKMKQKRKLFLIAFSIVAGFFVLMPVVSPLGSTAYAQEEEQERNPCGTEVLPEGEEWERARSACEAAVNGSHDGDPCAAIFLTLEAEGNDAASEKARACRAVRGSGSASTDCSP